jgi:1-deoxy-D-xylulose-5-phosphate reductoisomerase
MVDLGLAAAHAVNLLMKRISILGSTGSIGRQTLDVVSSLADQLQVVGLAAGCNIELVAEQTVSFRPRVVSVATEAGARELAERLAASACNHQPHIVFGPDGIETVATLAETDIVVSAAVGVAGLPATFKAVQAGKLVALANKEVMVAAGELVMAESQKRGVAVLPVDSEHNAIHQCLRAGERGEVKRLILTASGGPFRKTALKDMAGVTREQALAHPKWKMGQRITIDSATMMNKGFEVIEARWLFGIPRERIEVVIHPQSTVHSMVEYVDGSILAQLGPTDMRMPIQYALTYPHRVTSNGVALEWANLRKLEFEKVSRRKFPCLRLAQEALAQGGAAPCMLNAADEEAVAAFLDGRIGFLGIAEVIEATVENAPTGPMGSIEEVLAADSEGRRLARLEIARLEIDRRRN